MSKNYSQYSDQDVWSMFVHKDKHAFQWLYEKYKRPLYGFFYKRLFQDKELAKDATQNLFLKIIEKKESFKKEYPFKTWLFTIANNMCKNQYRRRENEKVFQLRPLESVRIENKVDQEQFEKTFQNVLLELREDQRTIFLLRYETHLSIKEIATIVQVPEGSVKSSLFYSIKKIAKVLQGFEHINMKKVRLWKN